MSAVAQRCEILVPGRPARAESLVLTAPISFWGGVDPASARIIDVRHPQTGTSVAGRALFLPGTIGSSSASAVMLELVHAGIAPAIVVMHEPDAILLLGLVVAKEMGLEPPMALRLDRAAQAAYSGLMVEALPDGTLRSSDA